MLAFGDSVDVKDINHRALSDSVEVGVKVVICVTPGLHLESSINL